MLRKASASKKRPHSVQHHPLPEKINKEVKKMEGDLSISTLALARRKTIPKNSKYKTRLWVGVGASFTPPLRTHHRSVLKHPFMGEAAQSKPSILGKSSLQSCLQEPPEHH